MFVCCTVLIFNIRINIQKIKTSSITSTNRCLFKSFHLLLTNTKLISQYNKTYTLRSGLNHVNYLNIIKRDHVSATVRKRLHLASGWSYDHSGASYSYVGVRTKVGCRHMISFYNIPPIISVFKLHINSFLHTPQNSSVDVHTLDILLVPSFQLRYVRSCGIPILLLHSFQIPVKSQYS